jgi:hypothetical protein
MTAPCLLVMPHEAMKGVTYMARKESAQGISPFLGKKACEVVGAGNWTVAVHKRWRTEEKCDYWFRMLRMEQTVPTTYSHRFRPVDVLDLPKLAQVLAASFVQDGCIEQPLRDDLSCLAAGLDWFLNLRSPANSSPWVILRRDTVQAVLDYLWDDEFAMFRALSETEREGHIFHEIAALSGIVHGTDRTAEEYMQLISQGQAAC